MASFGRRVTVRLRFAAVASAAAAPSLRTRRPLRCLGRPAQIFSLPPREIRALPIATNRARYGYHTKDPKPETKNATVESARNANRHVFVLNDAQIASIKSRLHLSPDQEQMWPAVEAALRSIAYSKSRDSRRKGGGATSAEVASLDPYGPEVQGLKSAAFPLIMSFSDEQRSEVRSIAHVMGLDQIASQL